MVKNGDLRFLLLEQILANQLADLSPPIEASFGYKWWLEISTVRAHIERATSRYPPGRGIYWSGMVTWDFYCLSSNWHNNHQVSPLVEASSGQEWWLEISTVRTHIGQSSGRPNPQKRHLVVKYCDLKFLLLELILREQPAGTPLVEASSDQEWWLEISTVRAHICRLTGRSTPSRGI